MQRLRAAGAVIVAKTNMTEYAFSGVGANPHFGTPGNPFDRARVPGGSTSGGAVAVADGMCEIAIGSDTGGSTRIPAALCGIVGWKPSRQRVPTEGAFPLSFTLDSIGPMARTRCGLRAADAVMAGETPHMLEPAPLAGLRLGIPARDAVRRHRRRRCPRRGRRPSPASATPAPGSATRHIPLIEGMTKINAKGGFAPPEAFAIHRDRIARRGADIDPNVRVRIERGGGMSASDYVECSQVRAGGRRMDPAISGSML